MGGESSSTSVMVYRALDRKSSIENEPRTLNINQIQFAREAALSVLSTTSIEEALRIFTEVYMQMNIYLYVKFSVRPCLMHHVYIDDTYIYGFNLQGLEPVVSCVHDNNEEDEDEMMIMEYEEDEEEEEGSYNLLRIPSALRDIASAPF
nr:Coiled-coil domain-containing protein 18, putative isoform 1 [Ipomoea batatas]